MRIANDYYLIIDLEATCSNVGEVPRHEMEIIEIGAVLQSSLTYEIEAEFQTFVKPVRHPQLTDFCTELTGITQANVTDAPNYRDAIANLNEWLGRFHDWLFCSWGDYDRKQFQQDCGFHGVPYPFQNHLNLKTAFTESMNLSKKAGIPDALRRLNLEFEGSHHRGIDDARNIARVVRRVCLGT